MTCEKCGRQANIAILDPEGCAAEVLCCWCFAEAFDEFVKKCREGNKKTEVN